VELIHLDSSWLDGLVELEQHCFPEEPWPASLLASALEGEGVLALGLASHDVLWASALGRLAADEAELHSIAVRPARRREGLGRRLLEDFLGLARGMGARSVWLEVRASNEPALRLYRSMGFHTTGRRPHYYADGEDALLLVWREPPR
jgi:ribosomal-protein-alanine N-acetyltransferase